MVERKNEGETNITAINKCWMEGERGNDRKPAEREREEGKDGGKDREAHSELRILKEKHKHTSTRSLRECR